MARRRYLPPDDPSAWADAISATAGLSADERSQRARAGRERAGSFTWERTAEALLRAYRDACGVTLAAVDCHMVGQRAAGDAGNARYATTLVAAMAAAAADGDAVASLVASPEGARQLDAFGRTIGVPAADVPRLARAAPRALADLGADVAVFTYVAPGWCPCPLLLAVHDATFMTNPEWLGARARAVLRGLVPRSARQARVVLALSETARGDVAQALRIDPGKVRVVSPHHAPAFTPADGAAERVRERFGVAGYVLAVGDLGPRKNLAALGAAVRSMGRDRPPLVLVGKPGPGGEAIAAESGGRWLGPVGDEDLADLYRAAAVMAYPSHYEGFGLPVLEAMACGCPVVASDRGAIPEVAGDAAILVEPTRGGDRRRPAAGARPRGRRAASHGGPGTGGALHPGGHGPRRLGGRAGGDMRIAMVGTRGIPAAYSGFETAVEHLAERFAARGHEVTVYCRPHMTERRATHAGARLVHLPTIRSKHLDTLAHTLVSTAHLAARERPDVALYFIAGNAPAVPLARLAGVPADPADRRPRLGARQVVGAGARVPRAGGAPRAGRRDRSR